MLNFSPDGVIQYASPACWQMFGVEPEDLVGLNGYDLIEPADYASVVAAFASIPNLGDVVRVEFRLTDAGGTTRWLEQTVTNLIDDPGIACVVGNLREITERVELLQTIETDRRRLADAQASAKLASFELNLDTIEITRSDELCRMLGIEPGSAPTADLNFVHPDDRDRLQATIALALDGRGQAECTYRIVRTDGAVRWVLSQATRLSDSNSNLVVGTMLDITDRHEAEMLLSHQATHDWLTGLPNASSLHDVLGSALSAAQPDAGVAVVFIDIDHFKLVNDRCGHVEGDQALRELAERLRYGMRDSDTVARLGGDELIVARTGVRTLAAAAEIGTLALELLRQPLTIGGQQVHLTSSVGVALGTATDSPTSLLQDADDAMYQSKRDGRNRVTVFDEGARARAHRRRSISAALPHALERDELHLMYQPILDVADLRTVGFEALLRWEHPVLGPIGPDEFIPLAEESGMIRRIGEWVLDCGARQLATWHADPRLASDLWLAINVSAAQLAQPDLATQLATTIDATGVPASAIHLEITESVLMSRIDDAVRTVVELQAAGFRVSIDDFGTGYSSLSYLSRLPVNSIKIDRSFISGSSANGSGWSIVRATIALAGTLGLEVVAEGIETQGQFDMLRELGCTYGQGFLWSRPLLPEAALHWITDDKANPYAVGRVIADITLATGRRRRTQTDNARVMRFDSLAIGIDTKMAWLGGRDLGLTPKEYELLRFLAGHTGQVFTRDELLQKVWKSSAAWQQEATVTEHIHRLRNRIEADPRRPRLVTTVHGLGYCFGYPATVANATEVA